VAHELIDLPAGIELRPASPEDREFLVELYRSTRQSELDLVEWTDDAKSAFVDAQFTAQDAAYRAAYPDGQFDVVLVDGRPAGKLYLGRLEGELRVIDIIVAPELRGRGIGTALMRAVIDRAAQDGLDVTLHVEVWNPALRIYERLGFERVETRGINEFLRHRTDRQLKTAS
jgi:ribosomal protein S18 acetylase RimI-like enzyme